MCRARPRTCPTTNMNDIKKRLSRTLSGPRRCVKCQKMVYFSIYRCKQCQELTHKHCLYHTSQTCKPKAVDPTEGHELPVTKPGDFDGWRSPTSPRDMYRHRTDSPSSCDADDVYRQHPGVAMAGLLKIVQWLSHRRHSAGGRATVSKEATARTTEKHARSKFGLRLNVDDKQTKKKLKNLIKTYQRQMSGASLDHGTSQSNVKRDSCGQNSRPRSRRTSSGAVSPRSDMSSPGGSRLMSPISTPEIDSMRSRRSIKMVKQASIKWERDVVKSLVMANSSANSSPADSLDLPRNASTTPKTPPKRINDGEWAAGNFSSLFGHMKTLTDSKATTISFDRPPCLSKAKTLSVESRECKNESLCATWPPSGKTGTILEEIVDETVTDCIEEADESFTLSDFRSDSQSGEESLREWFIPFGDIEIQERIRHGRRGDVFKGKWYGEVLVYTISDPNGNRRENFLDEVAQMGLIRHENIVLFMGACIEPQRLAVVTSMRKGPTLFEYLHLQRHRLPFHSKHNIARQIAQGIGYLHAKGIIHKKLNSKNIILECRVKVCIMDHSMADKNLDRSDYGCIPRGHLSYISPELMSSLKVEPPRIYTTSPNTQASDIFAFGSLLFELLSERFALHDQPPHALIWQVSRGRTAPLHRFRFISGIKSLIKRCWSKMPEQRPPFSEVVQILHENVSHHRRHSCSEPDRLHLTGQSGARGLCT